VWGDEGNDVITLSGAHVAAAGLDGADKLNSFPRISVYQFSLFRLNSFPINQFRPMPRFSTYFLIAFFTAKYFFGIFYGT